MMITDWRISEDMRTAAENGTTDIQFLAAYWDGRQWELIQAYKWERMATDRIDRYAEAHRSKYHDVICAVFEVDGFMDAIKRTERVYPMGI